MNPLSEDVKDKLVAASIGTFASTSAWGIFINTEPDLPDSCITLYDTGGPAPEECFSRSINPLLRPSIQVRVRGTTYLATFAKMKAIINVLRRIGPWTLAASSTEAADVTAAYNGLSLEFTLPARNFYQTFTVGTTGTLTKLEFLMNPLGGTTSANTFKLYSGTGTGGTLLMTQSFNLTFATLTIPKVLVPTSPPTLTAGQDYSLHFAVTPTLYQKIGLSNYAGASDLSPAGSKLAFTTYMTVVNYPAVYYWDMFQTGLEMFLQKDQKNRFIWVADFYAIRKEV